MHAGSVDDSRVARRHRESPYPIIPVDKALKMVVENVPICGTKEVDFHGEYLFLAS